MPNFTGIHLLLQSLQRGFDIWQRFRRALLARVEGPVLAEMVGAAIGPVELIEVYYIGLQVFEAVIYGGFYGYR